MYWLIVLRSTDFTMHIIILYSKLINQNCRIDSVCYILLYTVLARCTEFSHLLQYYRPRLIDSLVNQNVKSKIEAMYIIYFIIYIPYIVCNYDTRFFDKNEFN